MKAIVFSALASLVVAGALAPSASAQNYRGDRYESRGGSYGNDWRYRDSDRDAYRTRGSWDRDDREGWRRRHRHDWRRSWRDDRDRDDGYRHRDRDRDDRYYR